MSTISEFEQVLLEFMSIRNDSRSTNRGHFDGRREHKHWPRTEEEREKTFEHGLNKEKGIEDRQPYARYPKRQNQFKTETTAIPSTSGTNNNKAVVTLPKN